MKNESHSLVPSSARNILGIQKVAGSPINVLNLPTATPNAKWGAGYTIGRRGIQFGLVNQDDCIYMGLSKSLVQTEDWTRPVGCIQFYDSSDNLVGDCQRGTFNVDTGATNMELRIGATSGSGTSWTWPAVPLQNNPINLFDGAHMKFHLGKENANSKGDPSRTMTIEIYRTSLLSFTPVATRPAYARPGINADKMMALWTTHEMYSNTARFFSIRLICVGLRMLVMLVSVLG